MSALCARSAHVSESSASFGGVFVESGSSHSLLVLGVERSKHGDADAEDGQVGLEDEKENGGRHCAGDVVVEIDGGDVDKSEDCAYNATVGSQYIEQAG